MSLNDPLANVLSAMRNAELRGKASVQTRNCSTLIKRVLDIIQAAGYIEGYDAVADSRGETLTVRLAGRINSIGVVKPRFRVRKGEFERFEKRFLPARGFGILIVSTSKGLLTHEAAKEAGIGGVLVSYCY